MQNESRLPDEQDAAEKFARQAREPQAGFLAEFAYFLLHNKKWWLTPIIIVLLLLGILLILGSWGATPLVYPLL